MAQTKYLFITGGVVSSLGKGIAAASIGSIFESRGLKVSLIKVDPYINVDPGTMSPFQHGEVFVTNDGTETDLDLGHYERFVRFQASKKNNFTAGKVYESVIKRERKGDYLGRTVQIIPHVTDEIKKFILSNNENIDFCLCEIGGTVGDIEGLPFFEAIRQLSNELKKNMTCFLHLTLVPYISAAGEVKTKPTQHSVKELRSIGIQPDILVCRCDRKISKSDIRKISVFCNVNENSVIQAIDVDTIYAVPRDLKNNGLDIAVLNALGKNTIPKSNLRKWNTVVDRIRKPIGEVKIGVVGKYLDLNDAYKSLFEALTHGGISNNVRVKIDSDGDLMTGTTSVQDSFIVEFKTSGNPGQNTILSTSANVASTEFISFRVGNTSEIGSIKRDGGGDAIAFNTSSDYRLKQDIADIDDGITRLKTLQPRKFKWKSDTSKTVDGFIAHEVTAVPESITGTKDETTNKSNVVIDNANNIIQDNVLESDWTKGKADGTFPSDSTWSASKTVPKYQQIDQAKLVPLLTAALQEAVTKIEALEARVTTLEG